MEPTTFGPWGRIFRLSLSILAQFQLRPRFKGASGRATGSLVSVLPSARLGLFLAQLREAVHEVACELCATATSNPLQNVVLSRQSRRVGSLGYRARQIWRGSP